MTKPTKEQIRQWREQNLKCELYCDNFENFKRYDIPKAQLIIADIPYNVGKMHMVRALNGIRTVISRTVKVIKLIQRSSTVTRDSTSSTS